MIKEICANFSKYKYLLCQLIVRDFKVKYKRSVLGIFWSILYPLLTMSILAIVFTNFFRFSMPGVNFLVYLMSGLIIFNFVSEATNLAMSSIIANFSLLSKVYIPKYIFPLSKVLFCGINFLLTLIPFYIIVFATGTGTNIYHLLLPFMFICVLIFAIGLGLILSTLAVFFRDMLYIYGVVTTLWMYLTPIIYPISIVPENIQPVLKMNPLYIFIRFGRQIILHNTVPSLQHWIACFGISVFFLIFGLILFKKQQEKFIYYG